MKLYLVRHGEALNPEVNIRRPLSEKGRNQAQRLANFLLPAGVLVTQVFHSGKLRAQQTAEILASVIAPGQNFQVLPALDSADLELISDQINNLVDDTLIVGHIPLLPRLVAKLVTGNENLFVVDFQPATMACLQRISLDHWCISFVLNNEILPNSFGKIG